MASSCLSTSAALSAGEPIEHLLKAIDLALLDVPTCFESISEDVLAAYGPPFTEDHAVVGSHVLWFHDGEMRLRFHFTEGYETPKPERLIVIELIKCGER